MVARILCPQVYTSSKLNVDCHRLLVRWPALIRSSIVGHRRSPDPMRTWLMKAGVCKCKFVRYTNGMDLLTIEQCRHLVSVYDSMFANDVHIQRKIKKTVYQKPERLANEHWREKLLTERLDVFCFAFALWTVGLAALWLPHLAVRTPSYLQLVASLAYRQCSYLYSCADFDEQFSFLPATNELLWKHTLWTSKQQLGWEGFSIALVILSKLTQWANWCKQS